MHLPEGTDGHRPGVGSLRSGDRLPDMSRISLTFDSHEPVAPDGRAELLIRPHVLKHGCDHTFVGNWAIGDVNDLVGAGTMHSDSPQGSDCGQSGPPPKSTVIVRNRRGVGHALLGVIGAHAPEACQTVDHDNAFGPTLFLETYVLEVAPPAQSRAKGSARWFGAIRRCVYHVRDVCVNHTTRPAGHVHPHPFSGDSESDEPGFPLCMRNAGPPCHPLSEHELGLAITHRQ